MRQEADLEREIAEEYNLLFPYLNERQRRLLMGSRARILGHGGITRVARILGVHPSTVSKGITDLVAGSQHTHPHRARRAGAGRKKLTVSDPSLVNELMALMMPAGQPDEPPPLQWTTMST